MPIENSKVIFKAGENVSDTTPAIQVGQISVDVPNKQLYVDTDINVRTHIEDNTKLSLSGGTLMGNLIVEGSQVGGPVTTISDTGIEFGSVNGGVEFGINYSANVLEITSVNGTIAYMRNGFFCVNYDYTQGFPVSNTAVVANKEYVDTKMSWQTW